VANGQSFQNYFAPEIHSPLIIDESNTFDLTMSSSAGVNGKAPMRAEGGAVNLNDGARYEGSEILTVEPPKQSDLQVSPKIATYTTYLLALFRAYVARRSCESGMVWEDD
jgi:hypothetical protein